MGLAVGGGAGGDPDHQLHLAQVEARGGAELLHQRQKCTLSCRRNHLTRNPC